MARRKDNGSARVVAHSSVMFSATLRSDVAYLVVSESRVIHQRFPSEADPAFFCVNVQAYKLDTERSCVHLKWASMDYHRSRICRRCAIGTGGRSINSPISSRTNPRSGDRVLFRGRLPLCRRAIRLGFFFHAGFEEPPHPCVPRRKPCIPVRNCEQLRSGSDHKFGCFQAQEKNSELGWLTIGRPGRVGAFRPVVGPTGNNQK
jgi:hypothetical protein